MARSANKQKIAYSFVTYIGTHGELETNWKWKRKNQSVKSPGSHKVNFTNEMRKSSFLTTIESAT